MPEISVLMSAYNAEKYIGEAIESVLSQTFTDFEFIIINDGSTDNTEEVVFQYHDLRIKYYSLINQGISKSLNKGLNIAKGKYIAKLDADDVCYPNRFEIQHRYMEENPAYVVCGSYTDVISEDGEIIYTFKNIPLSNDEIKQQVNSINCFVHSATFYKRNEAIEVGGYYEPILSGFEDRVFFFQLLKKGKAINIPIPLIKYRIGPFSITKKERNKRYRRLVKNVTLNGSITEKEKAFLFAYKQKRIKYNIQLSNYYLLLARLYLIHQLNYKRSVYYYIKAIKHSPLNSNNIFSGVYMVYIVLLKTK